VYASLLAFVPATLYLVWSVGVKYPHLSLADRPPDGVLAAFIVLVVGSVFSLYAWRCPACGKSPTPWGHKSLANLSDVNPSQCCRCAARLR
jgi:hypothetical protein